MILSKMLPKFGCNRLRPLVWSAGVALTAVGAVYVYRWYCKVTPQEDDLPVTAESQDVSTTETPQAVNEENGKLMLFMYSPLYCGPVTIYRGVSETSGQLLPWRYSPLYCGPVVLFSGVSETSGQLLPWRYSPLYCGPVVLFSVASEDEQQVLPWGPLYCGSVVLFQGLPESGPLVLGNDCNQFTFQFSFRTHFELFLVKTHHIWMTRGPTTQLWWSDLVERTRVDHQGSPVYNSLTKYITGVKLVGAAVERYMSSSSKQNTHFTQFDGFLEQKVTWEHSGVYVDPCGQVFPSSWTNTRSFFSHLPGHTQGPGDSHDSQHASGQGYASGQEHSQGASSHYSHSHSGRASSQNHGPPSPPEHPFQPQQEPEEEEKVEEEESEDEYAEGEESYPAPPPGSRNASRLMMYLEGKQVQHLTNKIAGLREAFHSVLTHDTTKNFLLVAGRMILSGLVQLNQADVSSFCTSFNYLLSYVEDPAHRAGIERELASVNIHHINFLDIVYDFIILGVMKNNADLPPRNQEQGFLDHLFQVLVPILSPPTGWQPCAKMFQEVIQVQLMKLLDSMLDLDESTFSQADVLSAVLFSRLEGIIQELLEDLDGC